MIVFDLMAFSWGFNGVLMVCASSSDMQLGSTGHGCPIDVVL